MDVKGDSEEDQESADINLDGTTNTQNTSEHKYELQKKIQRQIFFSLILPDDAEPLFTPKNRY